MGESIKCPVCGRITFKSDNNFDICSAYGRENDGVQFADPDFWRGAKKLSLNQARAHWQELLKK